jgi:hypothetical protein
MRDTTSEFPGARSGAAGGVLAGAPWVRAFAPWALGLGLVVLIAVLVLTMPGNPILDLNRRQYRAPGTILSHAGMLLILAGLVAHAPDWLAAVRQWRPRRLAGVLAVAILAPLAGLALIGLAWPAYGRALTREWGLVEPAQAGLFLISAWIAWRHAALLGPRAADYRPYRFASLFCVLLAIEEMDWFGILGPLIGRVGAASVYVGSSHDLVKVAWHYPWFAIPFAVAGLLGLGLIWSRGYLTVGFIRREMFEPTTLLLYAAFAAQAVAQTLDVDDTLLSTRHPVFRYPLEEPCELLADLLLASGLLLKYVRDWRRAGSPRAQ